MKYTFSLFIISLFFFLSPSVFAEEYDMIEIKDMAFIPTQKYPPGFQTVVPGTKLTWINKDSVSHRVQATFIPKKKWKTIAPGESFSFTFSDKKFQKLDKRKVGYRCGIHPKMKGKIEVFQPRG